MISALWGMHVSQTRHKLEVIVCRKRLEVARKRHVGLKQKLEGEFGQLDTLESKVSPCPSKDVP